VVDFRGLCDRRVRGERRSTAAVALLLLLPPLPLLLRI